MPKTATSLSEARIIAENVFGLRLPVTLDEAKKVYRKKAMELHPDRNFDRDTTADFQAMEAAYTKLINCSAAFDETAVRKASTRTEDGQLLSELGMGLGAMVNARDCGGCNATGYTVRFERRMATCADCNGTGEPSKTVRCRDCAGTGKFTQKNSKRVVACRSCEGKGVRTEKPRPNRNGYATFGGYGFLFGGACRTCDGMGQRYVDDHEMPVYSTCKNCKGSGSERIFNPVIRRGAIKSK